MEETSTEAMVDTSATRDFIDQDFITRAKLPTRKLSQPIPVYNMDRTLNEAGSIREVVNMIMTYDRHSERILLAVTCLSKVEFATRTGLPFLAITSRTVLEFSASCFSVGFLILHSLALDNPMQGILYSSSYTGLSNVTGGI